MIFASISIMPTAIVDVSVEAKLASGLLLVDGIVEEVCYLDISFSQYLPQVTSLTSGWRPTRSLLRVD